LVGRHPRHECLRLVASGPQSRHDDARIKRLRG
jgi:hypothetical protein